MSTSTGINADPHRINDHKTASMNVERPETGGSESRRAGPWRVVITRLRHAVTSRYRASLLQQRLRKLRKAVEANPDSVSALNLYANCLESNGMRQQAAGIHGRLVTICRRRKEADQAAVYCRKLDAFGSPDAERCYREMATLYSELNRFDDAARAARRVVELYLSEDQHKAATGYIRQLPPLGVNSERVRAELSGMLTEAQRPEVSTTRSEKTPPMSGAFGSGALRPASSYSTKPLAPQPAPVADDVFLTGHMGRITPFDVVQIIESNALTGRLDFLTLPQAGAIFFRDGHIVAAISGSKIGYPALRAVFTAEPGPFRVVVMDEVPEDEFEARNNTGLVLDVLREIDEATENAPPEFVRPGQDDFYL